MPLLRTRLCEKSAHPAPQNKKDTKCLGSQAGDVARGACSPSFLGYTPRRRTHEPMSRDTIGRLDENDLKPWLRKMRRVPKLDAEFVARVVWRQSLKGAAFRSRQRRSPRVIKLNDVADAQLIHPLPRQRHAYDYLSCTRPS